LCYYFASLLVRQLRDYGHPNQWGLEPTFEQYLQHLWDMMDEIYRVLKPTGTVWINLGDTYGGSGKREEWHKSSGIETSKQKQERGKTGIGNNAISKCLLLIPHRFAIGCIERGWVLRNDCVWAKRNGMPESVTDRFSKKHEYMFFMTKQTKYYFDLNAVREKCETPNKLRNKSEENFANAFLSKIGQGFRNEQHELGKNPGSVSDFWDIPTKPSNAKHYASYNTELITKPILAGCPEDGIIYDPFMGTGSTAEAAIRGKRKFIGSELNSEYCDIANKRLKPYLNQTTLF